MTPKQLFRELEFTRENVLAWAEERILDEPMLKIEDKDVANTVEQVLRSVLIDHYMREWLEYKWHDLLELVRDWAMNGTQPINDMTLDELLDEIVSVCNEAYDFETMDDFVRCFCGDD